MNFRFLMMAAWLIVLTACPRTHLGAAETYSFGPGARGFLIRDYNAKIVAFLRNRAPERVQAPQAMDEFGLQTEQNTRVLQSTVGVGLSGRAGPAEFAVVGLPWPDEFERCANLIDCWEGTLNKLEGSSESEDAFANVTYGIVGFTSQDGSLQLFLQQANVATHGAVFRHAREHLQAKDAAKFVELVDGFAAKGVKRNHEEFVRFAIRNPGADPGKQEPRPEIAKLFAAFEGIPGFRQHQLAIARKKCWDEEMPDYREQLFGKGRSSLRIDLFCFDMTVLTNGPGKKELRKLEKLAWSNEVERMKQIADAMQRSPEYDTDKRADILQRERCIIQGRGEVHEDDYDLRAFALLPDGPDGKRAKD